MTPNAPARPRPQGLRQILDPYWQRWLQRRHPRGARSLVLTQNRIYIFLSRGGLVFGSMLLAMLGGAINYDLALAYLLVFLLVSMALVSVMHTFRNLLGLGISPGATTPAFVGGTARFDVLLENPSPLSRQHVVLTCGEAETATDIPARDNTRVGLALPARERGWLAAPRLRIETCWPLGVFQAWSYAHFDQRALVYPQPETDAPPLPLPAEGAGSGVITPKGHDDFAGLRPFAAGDSPRHIAWKSAARGDLLQVKAFHGEAARSLWLDWHALPPALDGEQKLSRLCAWVLQCHTEGMSFGLSLPGQELPPAEGDAQRDACLGALALFGQREAAA